MRRVELVDNSEKLVTPENQQGNSAITEPMITIMCQAWKEDWIYLPKFISHHIDIGIYKFIIIIDEYIHPLGEIFPGQFGGMIRYVDGVSSKSTLIQRQIENYNYYLPEVDSKYLCIIDTDEFLHQSTIKVLSEYRPQSLEIPWRILCAAPTKHNKTVSGKFTGIMFPQIKSISKVSDILHAGIHRCYFRNKGKSIQYGKTLHIPINHFYVRNASDLEPTIRHSSQVHDKHFSWRAQTSIILSSMCALFGDYQVEINLKGRDITAAPSMMRGNTIAEHNLQQLRLFFASIIWMSQITGKGFLLPIKQAPSYLLFLSSNYRAERLASSDPSNDLFCVEKP